MHIKCYEIAAWLSSYPCAHGIKIREGNTCSNDFIAQMQLSLPPLPQDQLVQLHSGGKLQASWYVWQDCF